MIASSGMSRRGKLLICAALLATAGAGTIAWTSDAGPASPAAASAPRAYGITRPAMKPMTGRPSPALSRAQRGGKGRGSKGRPKKPGIKDLITTDPVTVDAGSTRVVALTCGKAQGIALDGGVVSPPPPAQVVVSTISRANPNPPFANSRRRYYVGVRNLDPVSPATFRGTLVCAKGIEVR